MTPLGSDIGNLKYCSLDFVLNVQVVRQHTGTLEIRIDRSSRNQRRATSGLTEGCGQSNVARKVHRKRKWRIGGQVRDHIGDGLIEIQTDATTHRSLTFACRVVGKPNPRPKIRPLPRIRPVDTLPDR